MPLGRIFGLAFFFLVFIAALTSAIALLEVVASFFIDTFHWKRRTATLVMGGIMAAIGVFASLSMGPLADFTIGGMNLFDAMGFLTDKILMPLAALATCIFVGHIWGVGNVTSEVERCGKRFEMCIRDSSKSMDTYGIYGHEVDGELDLVAQKLETAYDRILPKDKKSGL